MVIFGAVATVALVLSGLTLLIVTDSAQNDPSDSQLYAALSIIGLGPPIAWTLLNVLLLATRGQTGGQYVAGVRLVREDGARLSAAEATAWWLCFNPLLFSWPMALVAGLPLSAVIAIVLSRLTIAIFGALMVVCIAAPLVAIVSAALDGRNRALHDRIIGTIVVPAD
jgi:uncharacterized RDD family membrane protein YckC